MYANLAAGNGTPQLVFQAQPFADQRPEFRGKVHHLVLAVAFGRVHGAIRLLQQGDPVIAILGKNADADAGTDGEFMMVDHEWFSQDFEKAGRHAARVFSAIHLCQYNGKLISPKPGQCVGLTNP